MGGKFIAGAAKQDALLLEDDESREIAQKALDVASEYEVLKEVDPKVQAWLGLAFAIGGIYGAKIAAIKLMKAMGV